MVQWQSNSKVKREMTRLLRFANGSRAIQPVTPTRNASLTVHKLGNPICFDGTLIRCSVLRKIKLMCLLLRFTNGSRAIRCLRLFSFCCRSASDASRRLWFSMPAAFSDRGRRCSARLSRRRWSRALSGLVWWVTCLKMCLSCRYNLWWVIRGCFVLHTRTVAYSLACFRLPFHTKRIDGVVVPRAVLRGDKSRLVWLTWWVTCLKMCLGYAACLKIKSLGLLCLFSFKQECDS